jgi:hypothetical protein
MSFSSFIFFVLQNRRTGGWNRSCPRVIGPSGRGGGGKEGYRRVNIVQKCVQIYANAKMIPVETIPGMGEGSIKESSGGCEFKYDIFDTL